MLVEDLERRYVRARVLSHIKREATEANFDKIR